MVKREDDVTDDVTTDACAEPENSEGDSLLDETESAMQSDTAETDADYVVSCFSHLPSLSLSLVCVCVHE